MVHGVLNNTATMSAACMVYCSYGCAFCIGELYSQINESIYSNINNEIGKMQNKQQIHRLGLSSIACVTMIQSWPVDSVIIGKGITNRIIKRLQTNILVRQMVAIEGSCFP